MARRSSSCITPIHPAGHSPQSPAQVVQDSDSLHTSSPHCTSGITTSSSIGHPPQSMAQVLQFSLSSHMLLPHHPRNLRQSEVQLPSLFSTTPQTLSPQRSAAEAGVGISVTASRHASANLMKRGRIPMGGSVAPSATAES